MDRRWIFVGGLVACVGLMAFALFMQHVLGLEPCPLCIVQRVLVIALAVVMLVAALHGPRAGGRRAYGALVVVLGVLGIAVAARHVWLQHLPPDQVPECGPGLEYMLNAFPLNETLAMVFKGSGECAKVQWSFLGLSIPEWTLIAFVGFSVLGLFLLLARRPAARA